MRKYRYRNRGKLPIFFIFIGLFLSFVIFPLSIKSLLGDVGQADDMSSAFMSKLCIHVIESNSHLLSYHNAGPEKEASFPVSIMAKQYEIHDFVQKTEDTDEFILETFFSSNPFRQKNEGNSARDEANEVNDHTEEETDQTIREKTGRNKTLGFYSISTNYLSKEYILSNGAAFDQKSFYELISKGSGNLGEPSELSVGFIEGDIYIEESDVKDMDDLEDDSLPAMRTFDGVKFTLDQLKDVNFLIRNFYIVDEDTRVTDQLFHAENMLNMDMTLKQTNDKPQILIYHTHGHEAYADSRPGEIDDTVVGVGSYLAKILEDKYGYNVIHDKTIYDTNGRSIAYNYALNGINKILEENPSIEVVIDLHRDGMPKRSTIINGKETAQIMLFNGLCRDQNGPLTRLENPYLQDNLAFSLQLQLKSLELYPSLFYKNYLHCYRYNMHVRAKCILMELGTHENSLQSAKNAMDPFAEILDAVLRGESFDAAES